MIVSSWNMEGLTFTKQTAAISYSIEHNIHYLILIETWLRPGQPGPPLPPSWRCTDLTNPFISQQARRGKNGISLLARTEHNFDLVEQCGDSRWAVFSCDEVIIAGTFIEPSASDQTFE